MRCRNCGKKLEGEWIVVKFVGQEGARLFCKDCKDVKKVPVPPRYEKEESMADVLGIEP